MSIYGSHYSFSSPQTPEGHGRAVIIILYHTWYLRLLVLTQWYSHQIMNNECSLGHRTNHFPYKHRASSLLLFVELCVDMKELEFGNVIGRGSFAVVYRGCWPGKDVALK